MDDICEEKTADAWKWKEIDVKLNWQLNGSETEMYQFEFWRTNDKK